MHQCTHLWRRLCFVNYQVWPLKVPNLKSQRQILSNFHLITTHNHFFKPYVTLRKGKLVHNTTSYTGDVQNVNTWVIIEYYNRWSNYSKSNYAFVSSCGKNAQEVLPKFVHAQSSLNNYIINHPSVEHMLFTLQPWYSMLLLHDCYLFDPKTFESYDDQWRWT